MLNPPSDSNDCYVARSSERWPHRIPKGKMFNKEVYFKYPIYEMYGAAVLEQNGFEVSAIDAVQEGLTLEQTTDRVKSINPDLVIVQTITPTIKWDLTVAKKIKDELGCHINLIGSHVTIFHEQILKDNPFVDSVTRGEWDYILRDLAMCLEKGKSLSDVDGLSYRDGNQVKCNKSRPPITNLDELPYPARHLLDPSKYLLAHYTYKPELLIATSRGCPFHCIFCLWTKTFYDGKIVLRDPKKVVDEVEYVIKNYGAKEIYFDDDLFNISEKRVLDICQELIDRKVNIPWIAELRVTPMSKNMLRQMKKAGCIKIMFGVESGSQKILDIAKKDYKVESIRETFRLCYDEGIRTHATFAYGLPGETKETIRETIKFAKSLRADTIQCSIATPYPGTEYYDMAKKNGWLKSDNWSNFDGGLHGVVSFGDLTTTDIENAINRTYWEFYSDLKAWPRRLYRIKITDFSRYFGLAKAFIRRFGNSGIPKKI